MMTENAKHGLTKISMVIVTLLVSCATVMAQAASTAEKNREANLKAYVDLLRKDLKKNKVAILTEMMELGPEEASNFWPVYNEYDKALTKLADERVALIRMYAENYASLTDQKVTEIALGMLDLEGQRNELKKEYFQKISQALSAKVAARFLQIENQIEKLVDLQIASSLPIVE
jgi:hypothetical protein